jgi:hypothetical protein
MVLYIFPPELFIVSPDSGKIAFCSQEGLDSKLTKHPEKFDRGNNLPARVSDFL